jgi:hypothetical protein
VVLGSGRQPHSFNYVVEVVGNVQLDKERRRRRPWLLWRRFRVEKEEEVVSRVIITCHHGFEIVLIL